MFKGVLRTLPGAENGKVCRLIITLQSIRFFLCSCISFPTRYLYGWHPGACIMKMNWGGNSCWLESKTESIFSDRHDRVHRPYAFCPVHQKSSLKNLFVAQLRSFPLNLFLLFLSLSFSFRIRLGRWKGEGWDFGEEKLSWSPMMECWQAFSSHSSFEWTVRLGPVGSRPCVAQHAWGFGCLFLASFLLLRNKQLKNQEAELHCSFLPWNQKSFAKKQTSLSNRSPIILFI